MSTSRRPTNLTVDKDLLDEARALDINLSRAAEMGIARAVAAEKSARQFAAENAEVVRSTNEYIAKYGLPLRRYRTF